MRIPRHRMFVAAGLVATVAYLVMPRGLGSELLYAVIGASAVVAIIAAARRRTRRSPWLLMAGGQALFVAGDLVWTFYDHVLHLDPWPSPADGLYLAGYPVLASALWLFLRERSPSRDAAGVLDAAIVSVALGVLAWVFLMSPLALDPTQSLVELLISLAYPVGDVLLLVVLARLVAGTGARSPAFSMLSGSILMLLVADAAFMLVSTAGGYTTQGPIDAIWLLSYILWGAAVLHPSAGALSAGREPALRPSRRRLVLLGCAALICPGALLLRSWLGQPTTTTVLGAGSIAVFSLVVARMAGLVRQIEAQVVLLDRQHRTLKDTIAEREALADRLHYQAFHDSLTGLPNRALFRDRVRHALERSTRGGGRTALLFIDLDDFKEVNDALGHDAGDCVLTEVATRLRDALRASDTVARLGGDEFAVLIEDATGGHDAAEAVRRIQRGLASPIAVGDEAVTVRASVGIALDNGQDDVGTLLCSADAAMYRAKNPKPERSDDKDVAVLTFEAT